MSLHCKNSNYSVIDYIKDPHQPRESNNKQAYCVFVLTKTKQESKLLWHIKTSSIF